MDLFRNMAALAIGNKPAVQPLFNPFPLPLRTMSDVNIEHNAEVISDDRAGSISQQGIHEGSMPYLNLNDTENKVNIVRNTGNLNPKAPKQGENISSVKNENGNKVEKKPVIINQINTTSEKSELILGLNENVRINEDNTIFDGNNFRLRNGEFTNSYIDDTNVNNESGGLSEQGRVHEKVNKMESGKEQFNIHKKGEIRIQKNKETQSALINDESERVLGLEKKVLFDEGNIAGINKSPENQVSHAERPGLFNRGNKLEMNYSGDYNNNEKKPSVHITIGKIEVTAVTPQSKGIQKIEQKKSQLSLNDYLRSLNEDKR